MIVPRNIYDDYIPSLYSNIMHYAQYRPYMNIINIFRSGYLKRIQYCDHPNTSQF